MSLFCLKVEFYGVWSDWQAYFSKTKILSNLGFAKIIVCWVNSTVLILIKVAWVLDHSLTWCFTRFISAKQEYNEFGLYSTFYWEELSSFSVYLLWFSQIFRFYCFSHLKRKCGEFSINSVNFDNFDSSSDSLWARVELRYRIFIEAVLVMLFFFCFKLFFVVVMFWCCNFRKIHLSGTCLEVRGGSWPNYKIVWEARSLISGFPLLNDC